MNLSLMIYTIGLIGFILNRKNIILLLITIEMLLLAATFLIIWDSFLYDDITNQIFALYIISIAGAESAIGLAILVTYYQLHKNLFFIVKENTENLLTQSIN
jgi:NADH-ubiquinone oxidoreductase chain 4L